MLYRGSFIARIPNDEKAQSIINALKAQHGQLRLHGRHKDRKGAMKAVGRTLNTHGDLPWRLGTEIVIYRGESGMTFKQFQSVGLGDLVESMYFGERKHQSIGIVVGKRGKNKLKVVINGSTEWTTRNKLILFT
tara:strand:- start:212 stop:613 length:402 start_codon:yes stop_codon:yes gene_type:complete